MKQLILISLFVRYPIHLLSIVKAKEGEEKKWREKERKKWKNNKIECYLYHWITRNISNHNHTHTLSNHFDYEIIQQVKYMNSIVGHSSAPYSYTNTYVTTRCDHLGGAARIHRTDNFVSNVGRAFDVKSN